MHSQTAKNQKEIDFSQIKVSHKGKIIHINGVPQRSRHFVMRKESILRTKPTSLEAKAF